VVLTAARQNSAWLISFKDCTLKKPWLREKPAFQVACLDKPYWLLLISRWNTKKLNKFTDNHCRQLIDMSSTENILKVPKTTFPVPYILYYLFPRPPWHQYFFRHFCQVLQLTSLFKVKTGIIFWRWKRR